MTIPSCLECLSVLDKLVEGVVELLEMAEEDANAAAISVVEAGTNAIQHGNKFKEEIPVEFIFSLDSDALRVEVRDRGPGFNVEEVLSADPTTPEDILKPRGRGIFIMRSLMDEVSFKIEEGDGCRAQLTRYRKRPE
ncbi:MAG: ATP-binding protein [Candidatus Eisenbacteria sp.]|nr:ATP-binding protein [Candidatus Eisenbacteria bacterium]